MAMKLKMILFAFCLLVFTCGCWAQNRQICYSCQGRGIVWNSICSICNGKGTAVGSNMQQQVYNNGYATMMFSYAKMNLAHNEYKLAADKLYDLATKYDYTSAFAYLGICYEIGIGFQTNRNLAKQWYNKGAQQGDFECNEALKRIAREGFWPATDRQRRLFCQRVKAVFDAQYNSHIYSTPSMGGNSNGSSDNSNNNHVRCAGCQGTGMCSMCSGKGGYYIEPYIYSGDNTKVWKECSVCYGKKSCKYCWGRGCVR